MATHTRGQTALGQALAAAIAERGPITFADYMEVALYYPEGGYYTQAGRVPQGWEGDYLTSTDLHPLFGAAIGRQLAQIWDLLGRPRPFNVLENGAGRGHLARDIATWAAESAPDGFAEALAYHPRDIRDVVAPPPADAADPSGPFHVVLSNELIDAFAVHVVEHTADGLAEVYVDATGTPPHLTERLGPPATPAVADYLARFAIPWQRFPLGWRAEVNLAAEAWLARVADRLAPHGVVITIDYGDTARRLYTAERRRGTLLCYHQHQISDDPLALTGAQDITAHVNFSALIATGQRHGLRRAGLVTQRDFLLGLGLRTEAEALAAQRFPLAETARHTDAGQRDYLRRASLRHAIAALLAPAGMGGFRVLIQQRGLPGSGKTLLGLHAPQG